jgi:hypothetical protein
MLDAMLPDAVREHPVWSLRERFDEHVELDADSGLATHPANEPDGYPERIDAVAGPTPPLPDPDLTGAARRAPADERPGSDRGDLDGSDDMVEPKLARPRCVAPAPTSHHAHAPETHDE